MTDARTEPLLPRWLRVGGHAGWLTIGMVGALLALAALMAMLSPIVTPLLLSTILALVFAPFVERLHARRVPRLVGALVVLVLVLVVAAVCVVAVLRGVTDQAPEIREQLQAAGTEIEAGLRSLGVEASTAEEVHAEGTDTASVTTETLIGGILGTIRGLSVLLFMTFTGAVILVLQLLNGRRYAEWIAGHVGSSPDATRLVLEDSGSALRGYVRGTTIVAASNAVPIGLAAWLLGVPLVGAITIVTFFTAYIPYLGAIIAGVFVCLVALGAQGLPVALAMLAITLLVNNVLQNVLAPIAYGSALDLDPLVVLLVTTTAGIIGGVGLIVVAAPLTAIVIRAVARLQAQRAGP